jgi:hypothetical protein
VILFGDFINNHDRDPAGNISPTSRHRHPAAPDDGQQTAYPPYIGPFISSCLSISSFIVFPESFIIGLCMESSLDFMSLDAQPDRHSAAATHKDENTTASLFIDMSKLLL